MNLETNLNRGLSRGSFYIIRFLIRLKRTMKATTATMECWHGAVARCLASRPDGDLIGSTAGSKGRYCNQLLAYSGNRSVGQNSPFLT
jgi:hypothetical protein